MTVTDKLLVAQQATTAQALTVFGWHWHVPGLHVLLGGITALLNLAQPAQHLPLRSASNSSSSQYAHVDLAAGQAAVALDNSPPVTSATKLRTALTVVEYPSLKANVLGVIQYGGLLGAAGQLLSPQGPGGCDHNCCERCCNICTSAPFIACGLHSIRHRKTKDGKMWGASMVGVGAASTVFHSSSGKWRSFGRKLDYWAIAISSNLMLRAVYPSIPKVVTLAGIAATPFKPFLVSFANSAAMELKFLDRAQKNPKIKNAQLLHSACCLLGLGCFALEDMRPNLPLVHATWHCLSATAVATINALVSDVEQHELCLPVKPLQLQ